MSYYKVKNISVVKDDEGYYYISGVFADSCIRPLYYCKGTFGIGKKLSRVEAEKIALMDFYKGNLQGGSSRYRQVADKEIYNHMHLLNKYKRIDRVAWKASMRAWKADIHTAYWKQACQLADKLQAMADNELKDVLYKLMQDTKPARRAVSGKVEPFALLDKCTGNYAYKVTSSIVRVYKDPHYFTSAALYDKVTNDKWFIENFDVVKKPV